MDTEKVYTPSEIYRHYGKSLRTIQRYCDAHSIEKTTEGYLLNADTLQEMANYFYPKGFPSDLITFLNSVGIWHKAEHKKALKESSETRQKTTDNDTSKRQATPLNDIPINDAVEMVSTYAIKQGLVPKFYTEEEYQELIGQLERLEVVEENTAELKEQIAYLREANKELRDMLKDGLASVQKALSTLSERNTLEAKDKGLLG